MTIWSGFKDKYVETPVTNYDHVGDVVLDPTLPESDKTTDLRRDYDTEIAPRIDSGTVGVLLPNTSQSVNIQPSKDSPVDTFSVTIVTTAAGVPVRIVGPSSGLVRRHILIQGTAAVVYIGADQNVSVTTGWPIPTQFPFDLPTNAEIWAVTVAASTVAVMQQYDIQPNTVKLA